MFSIFAHVMKTLRDTNNPRVNCLKTIPFTAGYTYIAHIWQYPHPHRALRFRDRSRAVASLRHRQAAPTIFLY